MWFHCNYHVQIAARTAVFTWFALPSDRNNAVVIYACRNIDVDFDILANFPSASAVRTRRINNRTFPSTVRTWSRALELSKGVLCTVWT